MMTRRCFHPGAGLLATLFLTALLGIPAQAQYAGSFSRVGFGARATAMGNAQAADVFREASPWYNPALSPLASGQSIEGAVSSLSFDRSLQVLQVGAPLQQKAGIAAGLIHAAVSDIDGRDNSGFHTRTLSVDEFAGFLAFGLRLSPRLSAGINLQFFQSELYDGLSARTVGVDLGFAYRASDRWGAALVSVPTH
ncbi:MAG: hypothetical protein O3C45_04050, partial [Bacteroidetes bacterium]|nr:hypothetical protein [Bacteroidota bacterium]